MVSPDPSAGGLLSVPTLWPRASLSPLPEAPFLVHLTMHRAGPSAQTQVCPEVWCSRAPRAVPNQTRLCLRRASLLSVCLPPGNSPLHD